MKHTVLKLPQSFFDSFFDSIADSVFLEDGVITRTKTRINNPVKSNLSENFNIFNLRKLSMFAKFCDVGFSQMQIISSRRNELNEIVYLESPEIGSILPFKKWEGFVLPRVRTFIEKSYMKMADKILGNLGLNREDFNVSVVKLLLNPPKEDVSYLGVGRMLYERSWCIGPHVLFPFLKTISEKSEKYVSFPVVFFPFQNLVYYMDTGKNENYTQYNGQPLGINVPSTTFRNITTHSKFPEIAFLGMFTNTYLVVSRKGSGKIGFVVSLSSAPFSGEVEVSTKLNHLGIYRNIEFEKSERNRDGEYRKILIQSLEDCISVAKKGIDYIGEWNDSVGLGEAESPLAIIFKNVNGIMNTKFKSVDFELTNNFTNTNILSVLSDRMLEKSIENVVNESARTSFNINCDVFVSLDKAKKLLLMSFGLMKENTKSSKFIIFRLSVGYSLLKKLFPVINWKTRSLVDTHVRGHNALPVEYVLMFNAVRESPFYDFLVKMKSRVIPELGNHIRDSYENIVVPAIYPELEKIKELVKKKKKENRKISTWSFSSVPSLAKMKSAGDIVTAINYGILDSKFRVESIHLTSF